MLVFSICVILTKRRGRGTMQFLFFLHFSGRLFCGNIFCMFHIELGSAVSYRGLKQQWL